MIFGNLDPNKASVLSSSSTKKAPLHLVRAGEMRAVVVRGHELISAKMLACVGALLDLDDEGAVASITFRADNYPAGVNGISDHDTNSIAINLDELYANVVESAVEKACALSMSALWQMYVLATVAHEIHHLDRAKKMGREAYFAVPEDVREEQADDFAKWALIHLARRFDIEPLPLKDEPYLGFHMSAMFVTKPDDVWVAHQRRLIEQGLAYADVAGVNLKTLRQYLKAMDSEDSHPDWRQDTFDITITYHKDSDGNNMTVKPAPLQQPPQTVIAPMAQAATTVGAINVAPVEVGAASQVMVADMGAEGMVHRDDDDSGYYVDEDGQADDTSDAAEVLAAMTTTVGAPATAQAAAPYQAANQQIKARQPRMYPPNAYDDATITEYAQRIYKRCQDLIWAKAGWNGQGGFTNPHGVLEAVRIDDIVPKDVVMETESLDANGRWAPHTPASVVIKGQVFKNTGLPGYSVYINHRGVGLHRIIVAQNITKPSRSANDARMGNRIAWVIRGDNETNKWVGSFTNDVWKSSN
jgi:hypothetical protein